MAGLAPNSAGGLTRPSWDGKDWMPGHEPGITILAVP
jgi:hypothetical protein